jgi:outer membrane protein, heavy metal efflux system
MKRALASRPSAGRIIQAARRVPPAAVLGLLLLTLPASAPAAGLGEEAPADAAGMRSETSAPLLDDLIREALGRSPSLASMKARLDASMQMARVPGLPNPTLEVMTQDAGFPSWTVGKMEMSMVQIGLTQSFPALGRTGAEKAVGEAQAGIREAELEAARRQVVLAVRRLYSRLYALDREQEAVRSGAVLLETLAHSAEERYSASRTELEAVLKAQLSVSRLTERLHDLETERTASVAELDQLLDRPGDEPLGRVDSLPPLPVSGAGADSLVLARSPEVQTRRAAVKAAAQRLQLARIGYRPGFMAGGDIGLRGKLDPVVSFRVGLDLPLWETGRARYEVQAAEAELQMAREDQREAEASVRSAATRLSAETRRSGEQIRLYREALLPQSEAALEAARSSFLADRTDFSTVIEDFQMWLEARAQLAAREAEAFRTWAELESLTSAPPSSGDSGGLRSRP